MKKISNKKVVISGVIFCMAIILVAVLFLVPHTKKVMQADYPYYPEVSDITDAADAIIVGEVIEAQKVQRMNVNTDSNALNQAEPIPYTISKFKITNVIKGNVQIGDVIEVKQLGNYKRMPEAFLAETDGYFKLQESELLFLASYENAPYSTVNPTQGAVKVLDNQTLYSASQYSLFGYTSNTGASTQTLEEAIIEISKYVD